MAVLPLGAASLPRGCACATIWLLRRRYGDEGWRSTIAVEPVAGTEVPARRRAWTVGLREWLGNPLLVAVVSTLLVAVVVPKLTKQWQDHQKELDIQTALVGSMSRSSSDAIVSGRMIASGVLAGGVQQAYNDTFRNWQIDSSIDAAKLSAYFPGSDIADRWRDYGNAVGNYLQLTTRPDTYRPTVIGQLRDYAALPKTKPPIDWRALKAGNSGAAFQNGFILLALALGQRRDELVRDVLAEHLSGF